MWPARQVRHWKRKNGIEGSTTPRPRIVSTLHYYFSRPFRRFFLPASKVVIDVPDGKRASGAGGEPNAINRGDIDEGAVVGLSLDSGFNGRAFLWENGVMTDLNTLVPAGSNLFLLSACSINAREEIAGLAITSQGEFHAFLATPRH